MRQFFLRTAAAGDPVNDVYVVTGKQIALTASGKHYIKCFVGDKTCQCTARMWNATREIFLQLPDSGFVHVRGRVENYQNNNQVIIEQWSPAQDSTYHLGDLLPHTTKDVAAMFGRVMALCESMRNRHLKGLLKAFTDDVVLMDNFRRAPAAMSFHHAYIGGLLEHTLNAMETGDALSRFHPRLNRDLVVAGIFLHDLAKTWELKYENAFAYTDGGQLVGHVVKIAMWVEDKARIAAAALGEPIPRPLIDVLQHIMLSHHGEPEFGAAKVPATPEAIAVHMIENMDAKLTMALAHTRDEGLPGDGNWTEYLKMFSVRMYKPDVAPPDAEDAPPPGPPRITNPLFGDIR
ncbi:MAG TPA: HD domain-containing protein [Tepidisphaeraceae bacterium]|jgi:3'-5' exoribonuclease